MTELVLTLNESPEVAAKYRATTPPKAVSHDIEGGVRVGLVNGLRVFDPIEDHEERIVPVVQALPRIGRVAELDYLVVGVSLQFIAQVELRGQPPFQVWHPAGLIHKIAAAGADATQHYEPPVLGEWRSGRRA